MTDSGKLSGPHLHYVKLFQYLLSNMRIKIGSIDLHDNERFHISLGFGYLFLSVSLVFGVLTIFHLFSLYQQPPVGGVQHYLASTFRVLLMNTVSTICFTGYFGGGICATTEKFNGNDLWRALYDLPSNDVQFIFTSFIILPPLTSLIDDLFRFLERY